jgi:hypothetical protein
MMPPLHRSTMAPFVGLLHLFLDIIEHKLSSSPGAATASFATASFAAPGTPAATRSASRAAAQGAAQS